MNSRRSQRPLHLKFGYDQAVEMAQIEKNLRVEGFEGIELFFETRRCYDKRHENDLSYRERQAIAKANGAAWAGGAPALPSEADILRAALRAIRDGHNDPRALAKEVLEKLE